MLDSPGVKLNLGQLFEFTFNSMHRAQTHCGTHLGRYCREITLEAIGGALEYLAPCLSFHFALFCCREVSFALLVLGMCSVIGGTILWII